MLKLPFALNNNDLKQLEPNDGLSTAELANFSRPVVLKALQEKKTPLEFCSTVIDQLEVRFKHERWVVEVIPIVFKESFLCNLEGLVKYSFTQNGTDFYVRIVQTKW